MELDATHIEHYLSQRVQRDVTLLETTPLGDQAIKAGVDNTQQLKQFGYGEPVLLRYRVNGEEQRAVLHTMAPNAFGHERRSDRAAGVLLSYDTFNELPQHVRALDVGIVTRDAGFHSVRDYDEFFLLTEFVDGEAYAHDLQQLRNGGTLTDRDIRRAAHLAAYLADIHAVTNDDPALYRRRVRDLLGSGEGIMGLTDSYPCDFSLAGPAWLERVETACVQWRWRLKRHDSRLAQVHGDFHPFNVMFYDDVEFRVLDRSRGPWGEPADDVSCMAINYLFFSLQRSERLEHPFEHLWNVFWDTYLARSGDEIVLDVIAPFFAWRGLVVASPVWYNVDDGTRQALFRFIDNVLAAERFDPSCVNEYIC